MGTASYSIVQQHSLEGTTGFQYVNCRQQRSTPRCSGMLPQVYYVQYFFTRILFVFHCSSVVAAAAAATHYYQDVIAVVS